MLIQLIYASRRVEAFNASEVRTMVEAASQRNRQEEIGGLLCFSTCFFLQVLEGERDAVNRCYARISRDPRHCEPMLLSVAEISRRTYQDWGMGFLAKTKANAELFYRFDRNGEFDPYSLSANSAAQLLLAASRMAAAHGSTPSSASASSVGSTITKSAS